MYLFTDSQLYTIHDMTEINGGFMRPACRWHQGLDDAVELKTIEVEDWSIAFYTAYNKIHPGTY